MRAKEFIIEYKMGTVEDFEGVDMKLEISKLGAIVVKALDDWGNVIGRAHFNDMDGDFIEAQSLWVEPEARGQGVARKMYDFVTSHGYEIHRSPDLTKIKDQGKQSGEHHWQKNRGEETVWEDDESRIEKFQGVPMKISELDDEVEIKALDSQGNKVLGHVTFSRFYDDLEAKYVEVDERYRGQGIAQLMYDFATYRGYKVNRSYDQTDAGAGFWNKHRGEEETVWEGLTQGRNLNPDTEQYVKSHKWKLTTVNPMELDTDSFDDPYGRVIDIDTDHPINFKDPIIVDSNGVIIDGFHRAYQAQRQGLKQIPAYVPVEEIKEAFDDPYRIKWEKSDFGDWDALATLGDGTYLNIMFNDEGDEEWQVEFHRNHSQEVTGEGDAQRIFATVLTAIQQFIQKEHPWRIIFSAKQEVEPGEYNPSRAKLYNRMVQRYANAWGYDEYYEDQGDQVVYELTRKK